MSFQEGQAGAAMPRPTHPYLWTQEGWVYLAVVIDLYSRRVVGWSMDRRMKKALVIRALLMAINLRQPPGLLHHSDRGSQYASHAYQALLKQHGMICSMSRKGMPRNIWMIDEYSVRMLLLS